MANKLSRFELPQEFQHVAELMDYDPSGALLTPEEAQAYEMALPEITSPDDHDANLAEYLEDNDLARLATDIIDWVETDEISRQDWYDREKEGIRLLGVSKLTLGGGDFKGASKAVHPLLAEACVQFQARAISEMWPAHGPVKTVVIGDSNDQREQQSHRVQQFMNYQYTESMPGAFEEEDSMLFRLPLSGSCFKQVNFDPLCNSMVSRYIEASNMIVPYAATDLDSVLRYTERFIESGNDTRKKIVAGVYREVKLIDSNSGTDIHTEVQHEIDATEGSEYVEYEGDQPYERYKTYCFLDLPGFEDKGEGGKKTGIALPYEVVVDVDNQQVLSVHRNWREEDPLKKRWVQHIHYKFLPGLGFYGYGFLHTIGGLAEAATGAMRALLDAAGFANLQGGFRSRDAKIIGGDRPVGMGEFIETEASPEELRTAFFPLPYKEPSETLYKMLGYLDEVGRRFASTTEAMVGDANNTGPVGTTVALIEQGMKVFSAIHLRLHKAHRNEFRLLAELNAKFLPQTYPYDVPGESREVMQADFDGRVDVLPVSDPNLVSNSQRVAQAQATLELAERAPDLYDMRAVHRSMLSAMRSENIDELMPNQQELPRLDPVTENVAIMTGSPVRVFEDQDHQAHLAVHKNWWATVSDDDQERLAGAFISHVSEHTALAYKLAMQQLMQVQIPGAGIDPQAEAQIAQMAAQVSQIYTEMVPKPDLPDEAIKDEKAKRDIARRDAKAAADILNQSERTDALIENETKLAIAREINQSTDEIDKTKMALDKMKNREQ